MKSWYLMHKQLFGVRDKIATGEYSEDEGADAKWLLFE